MTARRNEMVGLPLRPTLLTVVVFLILFGSGLVGVLAYRSSRAVVSELWHRLSLQIASATTQRTLRYLEPARPAIAATQVMARQGEFDADDPMAVLRHLRAMLLAHPQFTWMSRGGEDGSYLAVNRRDDGVIRATWRTQTPAPDGQGGPTLFREYEVGDDGAFRLVRQKRGDYDPRRRPWYEPGRQSERCRWIAPFPFATVEAIGFSCVGRDERDGRVKGVWSVEYEASYLSDFLATLRVGEHGRAYVVTSDGLVVGHPDGQVTMANDRGETVVARADRHPDQMLRLAWLELRRLGGGARSFSVGPYLAMAQPFPEEAGIDWTVLVVVPADDFFGPIETQAWRNGLIALLSALTAILLGVFFSNRVSRDLAVISQEMERIGQFDLDQAGSRRKPSLVREINAMWLATESMKSSLRSFGKYVPRELVADLIRSGEEAVLGGRKTELTVLFIDVAGFTSTAERMEPDDLVPLLGEFMETMSEAVRQHGGTVDKYIGDALMAFWGAPRADAAQERHACEAALAMKARLAQLQDSWRAAGKPAFAARLGINSGLAVVGNFGSPERMNYTVIGDTVNLASRLEGLNKLYGTTILIGDRTARALDGDLVTRPIDYVAVKGKRQAVLIHELVGWAEDLPARTREALALYRQALDLYRDRDFQRAAELFERARETFPTSEDRPSEVMAERARAYAAAPPPEDWDGAFVVTEK